jgi:hypothetical protein
MGSSIDSDSEAELEFEESGEQNKTRMKSLRILINEDAAMPDSLRGMSILYMYLATCAFSKFIP